MNISLPRPLREWVQKQVDAGDYGSSSEFVREMIRRLRDEQWRAVVDQKLLTAMASPIVELTDKVWQQIRVQAQNPEAARRHHLALEEFPS